MKKWHFFKPPPLRPFTKSTVHLIERPQCVSKPSQCVSKLPLRLIDCAHRFKMHSEPHRRAVDGRNTLPRYSAPPKTKHGKNTLLFATSRTPYTPRGIRNFTRPAGKNLCFTNFSRTFKNIVRLWAHHPARIDCKALQRPQDGRKMKGGYYPHSFQFDFTSRRPCPFNATPTYRGRPLFGSCETPSLRIRIEKPFALPATRPCSAQ